MHPKLSQAAAAIHLAIQRGNKVLTCGNGGSACHAEHLAAELVGRFEKDRDPYPAVSLTATPALLSALANDYGFEHVFARQVLALGSKGDVLVAFSTSGVSENVLRACEVAREREMVVVGLVAYDYLPESTLPELCHYLIVAEGIGTANAQEDHQRYLHYIARYVEQEMERGK
jgi:D-sedoheptulose 7-phosphate isomerase